MPYAIIAAIIAAIGFGSGFFVEHQINKAEIQRMELSIQSSNAAAAALLKSESDKVIVATATAIKLNSDLDKAHEDYINTANGYDQQLDSIRLYSERRPCGSGAETASYSTGISQASASEAELSESLDRLVKQMAKQCDTTADYADRAYQFATLKNCGIARE